MSAQPSMTSLVPILAAALRLVANETKPGAKPYSADSYLPEHIRNDVASALALVDSLVDQDGGAA